MSKTRVNCPNCRQSIAADIEQLFDIGADPSLKQTFLSGAFNVAQCPHCGYQGMLATPLVYHDPDKELLLTYFPPELGLPVNEQERIIGPLITRATNALPQEKRKAYLLRPQTMLTLQGMLERVLEADGITREMIQAQQQRLSLLQRLVGAPDEMIDQIAAENDDKLDGEFYGLLSRLLEAAMMGGDQESARRLGELQKKLLPLTTFGRQIQEQSKEVEAAVKELQEAGSGLTREKLLELVLNAPNDIRLSAYVSLARQGMDYTFFQLFTDRIEKSEEAERARLSGVRERVLEMTRSVDQQITAQMQRARQLLNTLLNAPDIKEATAQNLPAIDEYFLQVFGEEMEAARKKGDLEQIARLKQVEQVLQEASAPPPEFALIEELLGAPDEQALQAGLEAHRQELTPEFMEMLAALLTRTQSGGEPEIHERLQVIYRMALRITMQANLQ